MRPLFYFLLFIFLNSCASRVHFQKKEFKIVDEFENAEYLISSASPLAKNVVFLFPDNLDSINWENSPLLKSLKRKNYKIVIPKTLGKTESANILLDSRTRRINTISNLYIQLVSTKQIDSLANLVLIGFGEGAYILPYLANHLPRVKQFFMINSGLGSPLEELQLLITEGDNSFLNSPKMRFFGVDDMDEMRNSVKEVLSFPEYEVRLGNKTNLYWKDYYNHPTNPDLAIAAVKGNIIFSKAYPLLSKTSKNELNLIINSNPLSKLELTEIEGIGDFREKVEIAKLTEFILDNLD